jgi:predicted ATP-binding protein involved in virulence
MNFNKKIKMIVNDISTLNNNIILLGENSVGKTTVLRELYLKNREISLYIENHKSKNDLFETIKLANEKVKIIIIDNIEVNLEYKDRLNILEELKEKFKNLRFIVSTNYPNMLINSVDFVHFIIIESNYNLGDSNDIQDMIDVDRIKSFIKKDKKEISETELLLSKCMNKNLFGIMSENDIKEIEDFLSKNKKMYHYQRELFLKIIREANYENR